MSEFKKIRIYFKTYFFHNENADKLFCVRNNNNYDWIFWFSDDYNFLYFFWISWFQEEKCKERINIFWKNYEFFLSAVSAFLIKNLFLTNLSVFYFSVFFVILMIQFFIFSEVLFSDFLKSDFSVFSFMISLLISIFLIFFLLICQYVFNVQRFSDLMCWFDASEAISISNILIAQQKKLLVLLWICF